MIDGRAEADRPVVWVLGNQESVLRASVLRPVS